MRKELVPTVMLKSDDAVMAAPLSSTLMLPCVGLLHVRSNWKPSSGTADCQ